MNTHILYVVGVQDLKRKQGAELLTRAYALTEDFKTASTYGFQPVLASEEFKEIFRIYLDIFRPLAMMNSRHTDSDEFSLLVTYDGEPETRVSRLVIAFFEEHLGVHVTTTMMRAVFESTGADREEAGSITPGDARSISHVNGHSSATAKKYYQRASVEQSARRSIAIFQPQNTLLAAPPTVLLHRTWGSNHPYGAKPAAKRVPFSLAELGYMTNLIVEVPQTTINFTSRCLKRIKSDPAATPIFHPRHILKCDRLRTGFRSNFIETDEGIILPAYRPSVAKKVE